jgi:uncharacterized hydrophobic protein (TIGR00271 family)
MTEMKTTEETKEARRDTGGLAAVFTFDREPAARQEDVRAAVTAGAGLSSSYFIMNAAATLIAGYGLLADSVAVIIGAMLIAMLYGPILGLGLAMAEANTRLLSRAFVAEALGAAWVLAIGFGLGLLHQDIAIGEQVLARTAPNLLDLMIALVGGAAGAYVMTAPRISSAVVGVAIATALCPPLTACGILFAHGQPGLAGGAFLLFLTNLIAIAVAAMLVFLARGHRAVFRRGEATVSWTARITALALLGGLGVYLAGALNRAVSEVSIRDRAQQALSRALERYPGARVIELRFDDDAEQRAAAFAVIRSPASFSPADIALLDDAVDAASGDDVLLHVRTVRVEELTRDGPVQQQAWPGALD